MKVLDLYSLDNALQLDRKKVFSLYKEHVNPSLAGMLAILNFDKQFIKAEGTKVWDNEGNEYLDFLGGYGALNFGHNHPYIIEAINKVRELPNILQASIGTLAAVLAYNLSQITPEGLDKVFFCNSGAEAVDGALKLARIATGRTKYLSCENSFHGKTFGALSVTGREKYQKYFKPLVPTCITIPFGDLDKLEYELRKSDVAAFIVEPVQGEGGIIVPPKGYLSKAKEICAKYGTLLIVDEIQTGFGRTGRIFACEDENVNPDVLCMAKSLGGGIMPIGAYITSDKIWNNAYGTMEKALLHTSTFGGNTYATAAGIASIDLLIKEDIASKARDKGSYFMSKLEALQQKYKIIKEVRGKGLMIGIEFEKPQGIISKLSGGIVNKIAEEYLASLVAGELQNKFRIITAYTLNNPNVIRLEPPLTVTYGEIDYVIESLENIFEKHKGLTSLAMASGKNFLNSVFNK